jgi:membrane protein
LGMIATGHVERTLNFIWKHFQVFLQKFILSIHFFLRNELINHAGASAFFFLLSITPVFLLILISFDRYLTSYPDVSDYFFVFLKSLNANLDKDLLVKIGLMNVNTTALGIFGLLSLIWAASWIVTGIQRGLGAIFPSEKIRPPIVTYSFSIFILSVLLLVTILFTFISTGLKFLQTPLDNYGVIHTLYQSLLPLLKNVFPFLATFVMIFLVYRFVPLKKPKTVPSVMGAVLCALCVIWLHLLFLKFFRVTQFNVIYGVLATLILMLLWVHFAFILFYFFAEYTFVSDKIDILVLERMYLFQLNQNIKGKRIEKFLFSHPKRIFEKYAIAYKSGEILFREGEKSSDIYFIYQGNIGIYRKMDGTEKKIATIRAGEILGEMAYLLKERRTATAIVETESVLLAITPDDFEELLLSNRAVSREVIHLLSHRLRKMHLL